MKYLLTGLLVVPLLLLGVSPAFAFDLTTVDANPFAHELILFAGTLVLGVLSALGGFAIKWVSAHTGLIDAQAQSEFASQYELILKKGIVFAEKQLAQSADNLPLRVDVHNPFIKMAADYVIKNWKDTLASRGITPETVATHIIRALPSLTETSKQVSDIILAQPGGSSTTVSPTISPTNVVENPPTQTPSAKLR